jgi:hypothetical protein
MIDITQILFSDIDEHLCRIASEETKRALDEQPLYFEGQLAKIGIPGEHEVFHAALEKDLQTMIDQIEAGNYPVIKELHL